jgi:protein phosphatase
MVIEAYGKTDRGRVRNENEDVILLDNSFSLFLVCDGMGGHRRGEVAAELAAAAIQRSIEATSDRYDVSWPFGYVFELSLDANRLSTGIRLANRQVWRRSEQTLECTGMATTVAAILIADNRLIVGNVGDSRVYLLREHQLHQYSTDDTMIASLVRRGLMTPADAASHPMRNVVTQSAGSRETVDVHLREELLQTEDVLLLCTDGLYSVVQEEEIQSILDSERSVERSVERLVVAALAAGGPDNISAVALRYS